MGKGIRWTIYWTVGSNMKVFHGTCEWENWDRQQKKEDIPTSSIQAGT
jgi:hypothetical protein